MFNVQLSNSSKRFLRKADLLVRDRIIEKIKSLSNNPFLNDIKRVEGRDDKVFRVRVGKYRITYVVVYEDNSLIISDIDKRSKIY